MHLLLPCISAGILLATWMPAPLFGLQAAVVLLGVAATCSVYTALRRGILVGVSLPAMLCALAVGVAYHAWWAHWQLQQRLPVALEGRDIRVQGFVDSLPRHLDHGTQFEFHVVDVVGQPADQVLQQDREANRESDRESDKESGRETDSEANKTLHKKTIGSAGEGADKASDKESNKESDQEQNSEQAVDRLRGQRLLLTIYGDNNLRGAEQQTLTVRLKRPHSLVNGAGFDFTAWLLQNNIIATGYVREIDNRLTASTATLSITALRQALRNQLQAITRHLRQGGLIHALALGDRGQLSQSQWQLFSRTGTNHLFVISGLHIGLVAIAVYWAVNQLLGFVPGSGRYLPRQKWALLVALAAAGVYSLLAGLTLPTQRAFIMTAAFLLSHLLARAMPVTFRFHLALLLVLFNNPLAATSMGFWLSFLAVGGLLCFAGPSLNARPFDGGMKQSLLFLLRPQWIVFLLLLVPLAMQTGYLTPVSPLINTLAIPLVGMLIVPLVLLGTLCALVAEVPAIWLLVLADQCLQWLINALGTISAAADFVQLAVTPANTTAAVFGMLGLLLVLLPGSFPGKYLAPVLLLPLFWPVLWRPAYGDAEVTVFDVGQGLSVLVRTRHHAMLFDTGAGDADSSVASSVLVPVLNKAQIKHLDSLVVSHGDNDHAGGVAAILANVDVAQVLSGQLSVVAGEPCRAGQHWQWDQVEFAVLHPGEEPYSSANNQSCVLRIIANGQSLLLPGDIESGVERDLVLRLGDKLQSDVLVAPHHGSNTSSGYPFLKTVNPDAVIFSAGYRNGFGHPAVAVTARYQALGIARWSTARQGAVRILLGSDAGELAITTARQTNPRYWRASGYGQ